MAVVVDEDAVRSVVLDYVEGWFEDDAGRMKRALHPELVKRCRGIEGDAPDALETLSAGEMIDATAAGEGLHEDAADRRIEIRIDYLNGGIASVRCPATLRRSPAPVDMPDGWKIVTRRGGCGRAVPGTDPWARRHRVLTFDPRGNGEIGPARRSG